MAKITSLIQCTIDPLRPVEEVAEVISAVLTGYDAPRQLRILDEIEKSIQNARSGLQPKAVPKEEA